MKNWLTAKTGIFSIGFWFWLVMITLLSLSPSLGNAPSALRVPHLDKVVHFSFYFGLSALALLKTLVPALNASIGKSRINLSLLAGVFIASGSYGMIIEMLQHALTHTRQLEGADMMANYIGSFMGCLWVYISFPKVRSLINKRNGLGELQENIKLAQTQTERNGS